MIRLYATAYIFTCMLTHKYKETNIQYTRIKTLKQELMRNMKISCLVRWNTRLLLGLTTEKYQKT